MEIRCCCDPSILIGSVPTPDIFRRGKNFLNGVDGKRVEVEIEALSIGWSQRYAIKSNDLPVEYFEKIKGFIPDPFEVPVTQLPAE